MKRTSLSFDFELERSKRGPRFLIGVDEVGRGCLAGPVVAAAVTFDWTNPEPIHDLADRYLIHDSKTLNRKQRADAAVAIRDVAIGIGIGEVDAPVIDEINILQATFRAMRTAIDWVLTPPPCQGGGRGAVYKGEDACILIDGNQRIPDVSYAQETIIDGDAKVFSVAAASIVAKEYRDALMERFDETIPGYTFSSHKGYGTKVHREAIRLLGLTLIHRKTFWHG